MILRTVFSFGRKRVPAKVTPRVGEEPNYFVIFSSRRWQASFYLALPVFMGQGPMRRNNEQIEGTNR